MGLFSGACQFMQPVRLNAEQKQRAFSAPIQERQYPKKQYARSQTFACFSLHFRICLRTGLCLLQISSVREIQEDSRAA